MLNKAKEELSWYEEHYGEELLAGGEIDDPIKPEENGSEATKGNDQVEAFYKIYLEVYNGIL